MLISGRGRCRRQPHHGVLITGALSTWGRLTSGTPQVSTFPPGLFNISIIESWKSFLSPENQPAIKSQGLPIAVLYHYFSYYPRCSPVFHVCRLKTKLWAGDRRQRDAEAHSRAAAVQTPAGRTPLSAGFAAPLSAQGGAHAHQGRRHDTIPGRL